MSTQQENPLAFFIGCFWAGVFSIPIYLCALGIALLVLYLRGGP